MTALVSAFELLRQTRPLKVEGVVSAVRGLTVHVEGLPLPVGSLVSIRSGERQTQAEIIGVTREHAIVMPLGQTDGIGAGDRVAGVQTSPTAGVGRRFLGRVVDGLGRPIDAGRPIHCETRRPLSPPPLSALSRGRITRALATGVRAIDSMTTLGRGQRMGIFAGPGVGKSTLMGTIARRTSAQVNVIALIGERGREVKDFIDHSLGPEGLARSVVVVATGDESPLMRVRAAKFACTLAENFRDHGLDVMLMMDSITRFAHAQRQIGLAVGEPPATRGYTPSVFAQMALLLERAGAVESEGTPSVSEGAQLVPAKPAKTGGGSITGLYTILVEGDDMTEPVADAARGILDGHLILSRKLAQRGHFPAIDVLDSVSRVADQVTPETHRQARLRVVRLMALYKGVEELVQIGAYARGSDSETDAAIELMPRINALLRQAGSEESTLEATQKQLGELASLANDTIGRLSKAKGR